MRTLAEDRDEVTSETERRWVARKRREYGIRPEESTVWEVVLDNGVHPDHVEHMFVSPGDALSYAGAIHARQVGTGRWIVEVYGEEGRPPLFKFVRPAWDEVPDF